MFGFGRVTPCFREFTINELAKSDVLSDCELMDIFGNKYCRGYKPSAMSKKLESFRKKLWKFKKDGLLEETRRFRTPLSTTKGRFETHEIFYKLK